MLCLHMIHFKEGIDCYNFVFISFFYLGLQTCKISNIESVVILTRPTPLYVRTVVIFKQRLNSVVCFFFPKF